MSQVPTDTDVFADVLNLEETYYQEGYALGISDGSKSGRIEGRVFGLEKGFEKFLEMGRLHGRAVVWEARLPPSSSSTSTTTVESEADGRLLPTLSGNDRLRKHVDRLAALSEPAGLSTENSEDAVSEFDDRLKDAKAKATLITRIVGEDEASLEGGEGRAEGGSRGKTLRVRRNGGAGAVAGRRMGEMEDFMGLPGRG